MKQKICTALATAISLLGCVVSLTLLLPRIVSIPAVDQTAVLAVVVGTMFALGVALFCCDHRYLTGAFLTAILPDAPWYLQASWRLFKLCAMFTCVLLAVHLVFFR